MKHEIRKFTTKYLKNLAKEWKENRTSLEIKLKELKGNLDTEDNIQSYNIYVKNLILYMIISLKVLCLNQNAIGKNTVKNPQSSF